MRCTPPLPPAEYNSTAAALSACSFFNGNRGTNCSSTTVADSISTRLSDPNANSATLCACAAAHNDAPHSSVIHASVIHCSHATCRGNSAAGAHDPQHASRTLVCIGRKTQALMRVRLILLPLRLRRNPSRDLLPAAIRAFCVNRSRRGNARDHRMLVPTGNPGVARLNCDHDRSVFVRSLPAVVPVEILRIAAVPFTTSTFNGAGTFFIADTSFRDALAPYRCERRSSASTLR